MDAQPAPTVVVAVDGTAGSGKSSASRAVAQRLGLRYLDTGAMYRAVTLWLLRQHVDVDDVAAVASALLDLPPIDPATDPVNPTITLAGEDVSAEIREQPVSAAVSPVSVVPEVRRRLVHQQQQIVGGGGIVVEGRDIGTVVTPHADVKIYLTAEPTARARRRGAEMPDSPGHDIAAVQAHLESRDSIDSGRSIAPLTAAPDATVIDSTSLTLEQVVESVHRLVVERSRGGARR